MANWVETFLTEHPEYASMPIFKRSRHGIHFQQGSDIIAHFTGNPCHYLDRTDGLYKPLDTNFLVNGNLYYNPGIPHITVTNGNVVSIGTGYSQITRRVGVLNTSTMTLSNVLTLPTGTLNGDRITKETVKYKHELIMKESGMREEFTIYQNLGISGTNEWLVLETEIAGITFPDGWLDTDFIKENYTFPIPNAIDANGFNIPIRRYARTVNGKQMIYTGIRAINLNIFTYPIMLDPDFIGQTSDGYIYGNSYTYSTARSTMSYYSSTETTIYVGQTSTEGFSHDPKTTSMVGDGRFGINVYRSGLEFPTNSIGAGSTVTQVNLNMTCTVDGSSQDFDIQIVKSNWDVMNNETVYDNILSDTLDDSIWRGSSGISINTQYTSGNLSTAWINKTSATKYGLMSSRDRNNTAPADGVNEFIGMASANHGTSGYRPTLTVAYTAGGSSDYMRVMTSIHERT